MHRGLGLITKFDTALNQSTSARQEEQMASGGSAIRGSRVGAGPMGEQDRGYHAERISISYWDALGNETVRHFAANLPDEEIPETIDSRRRGFPPVVTRTTRRRSPSSSRTRRTSPT